MKQEDFLKIVHDVTGDDSLTLDDKLEVSWSLGGASGGNCWGGEATSFISDEQEPDFSDLYAILEQVCPDLSFLRFLRLKSDLIVHGKYRVSEYYGNYTDYATKSISLKALYEFIK